MSFKNQNNIFQNVTLHKECNGMTCDFSIMNLKNTYFNDILLITFKGNYRDGSQGKSELNYMIGMTNLGTEVWPSSKVLIDIRDVNYEWGDDMESLFYTTEHLRTVIIVSDKNRFAISTLLNGLYTEKDIVDGEFFFDDFDKAVDTLKQMKPKEWNNDLQQWL